MNTQLRGHGSTIPVRLLGQSGCRLGYPGCVVYVDPYLSNSVQQLDAPDLERLLPVPTPPDHVVDADWVLLTHEHIDHCDPHTLPALARASSKCCFMGPEPVLALLRDWGVGEERLRLATEEWSGLAPELRVHAVPAAHPVCERDGKGRPRYVGYVLEHQARRLYIAGDTAVTQELIDSLAALKPIAAAMLPVNEQNFFRARRGIVGNMSVREAFQLADELGIECVIPVHWDMFAANSVSTEEMHAVYQHVKPRFRLLVQPSHITL